MSENLKFKRVDLGVDYPRGMACERIVDDWDGLRFVFSAGERTTSWLEISFAHERLSYRVTEEGDFLRTLATIPDEIVPSIAIEAINSEYLAWYIAESFAWHDASKVRHFILLSTNDCIEVLSTEAPRARLIPAERNDKA